MWFVQYLEYLFNLYIILFYFTDIFSGDDEVVFAQYDFPPDKIEAANSLVQNQLPASFHVGVAMTANRTAEVWNASGKCIMLLLIIVCTLTFYNQNFYLHIN